MLAVGAVGTSSDEVQRSTGVNSDRSGHEAEEHESKHGGLHIFTVDFAHVATPFIITLWVFCASIAKIIYRAIPKLSDVVPESCLLILVGILVGLVLLQTGSTGTLSLTPSAFFLFLLPPIILDAGYFMPNRAFFDHLGTIIVFAVVGTIWNTVTIGLSLWAVGLTGVYGIELSLLETLLFSSLISAVDPVAVLAVFEEIHVNEILYIIVFGESLLNDAVTVVLYNTFDAYLDIGSENIGYTDVLSGFASFMVVALGGTIIGVVWGFLTGFVTRFTHYVLVIEPFFVYVMSYLAYLIAEMFHMSGILAIMFCGITMKNYVEENISSKSHTTVKYTMKMSSNISETIIFMLLGVNTVHDQHDWNTSFILFTILFCSVYRTIGCIGLAQLANQFRLQKLNNAEKFVMSYGGLRGAVAFALVLLINKNKVIHQPVLITATISVVFFTVFIQGMTIKPLTKLLKVKRANKFKKSMNERIHEKLIDYTMVGIEDVLGGIDNMKIRNKFKQIDYRYIRPCLVRDHKAHEPKILETFCRLEKQDAMENMHRNDKSAVPVQSESMAGILRNYAADDQNAGQNPGWNLDMGELVYNPSAKDLSDAKIHHLLSEESWTPYNGRRIQRPNDWPHCDAKRHLRCVSVHHCRRHRRHHHHHHHHHRHSRCSISTSVMESAPFQAMKENGSAKKLHDEYLHSVIREVCEAEGRSQPSHEIQQVDRVKKPPISVFPVIPVAAEMPLPWKRNSDSHNANVPVKQTEFPSWVGNEECIQHHSSLSYLCRVGEDKSPSFGAQTLEASEDDVDVPFTSAYVIDMPF